MNDSTMDLFEAPATAHPVAPEVGTAESAGASLVEARLRSRCWDFPDSRSPRQSLHAIHPYPAKFIPEIPRAVIAEFTPPTGTVILDPFCGSGTSLVEAQRAGFDAIGIDLNPIACRISRVKTGPSLRTLGLVAARCRDLAASTDGEVPDDIPNLEHWFQPQVSRAVSALKAAIRAAPSECQEALELTLSSILVRVSNQDSDTRYAAVPKKITRRQVLDWFLEAAGRMEEALRLRPEPRTQVKVLEADVLSVKPEAIGRRVGLVVTSPPYPNAYEYWLYHKYRMWWLGHDAHQVREREIGARAHFFGGGAKASDFERQMARVFRLLDQICTADATICFVVGDSKIHGRIVDNATALKTAALAAGFGAEGHVTRNLRANKKSFNLAHARIRQEHILVFQRRNPA